MFADTQRILLATCLEQDVAVISRLRLVKRVSVARKLQNLTGAEWFHFPRHFLTLRNIIMPRRHLAVILTLSCLGQSLYGQESQAPPKAQEPRKSQEAQDSQKSPESKKTEDAKKSPASKEPGVTERSPQSKEAKDSEKTPPSQELVDTEQTSPEFAEYQTAVCASAEKFVEAFNEQDAEKIAQLFTEAGESVDVEGTVFLGRQAIADEYMAHFEADANQALALDIHSIRPVAPGVLIEDGMSYIRHSETNRLLAYGRYSATHVRQDDGTWLLASVRELTNEVTAAGRLQPLSWLVGKWIDESNDMIVKTEWSLDESGSFLDGKFEVHSNDDGLIAGTQRIAWDPSNNRFRHWLFTNDGGFGEGYSYLSDDDDWVVHSQSTAADGRSMQSILKYQRAGEDAAVIEQTDRWIGADRLPDRSVRIVRAAPAPGEFATEVSEARPSPEATEAQKAQGSRE